MPSITVRNIDEHLKRALKIQAAENGRSMEEHVRTLLSDAIRPSERAAAEPVPTMASVMRDVRMLVDEAGGFDIDILKEAPVDAAFYAGMHAEADRDTGNPAS